jgi:NAD(P)-dependent dehydrogenase (short-subunit alcohol dehydrogenase family)
MKAQAGGSIVNLSSPMGHRGFAFGAAYVASKHAIEGLTRSATLEGAPHNIRVNAIAPGTIRTAMLDQVIGGSADMRI